MHSAIEKYKQALEATFDDLVPLYNIAQQYNALSLYDAELEALNLLVTVICHCMNKCERIYFNVHSIHSSPFMPCILQALENKSADDSKLQNISSILASSVFASEMAPPAGLGLLESLYALSRRCLELTR